MLQFQKINSDCIRHHIHDLLFLLNKSCSSSYFLYSTNISHISSTFNISQVILSIFLMNESEQFNLFTVHNFICKKNKVCFLYLNFNPHNRYLETFLNNSIDKKKKNSVDSKHTDQGKRFNNSTDLRELIEQSWIHWQAQAEED